MEGGDWGRGKAATRKGKEKAEKKEDDERRQRGREIIQTSDKYVEGRREP